MNFNPLYKDNLPEGRDSLQEVYFEWWLDELIKYGLLDSYKRSTRYKFIEPVFHNKLDFKPIKKDPERHLIVQREFLKSWSYEPDYDLYWNEKSFNFLFMDIDYLYPKNFKTLFTAKWVNGKWLTVVDIKPPQFSGGKMSSSVKFPIIQKMLYSMYDIYVHKVSPIGKKSLFQETFTPERYLYQDVKQKRRRISQWKTGSIEFFLKENLNESVF